MKTITLKTALLTCLMGASVCFAQTNTTQDALTDSVPRKDGYNWVRRKNVINVNFSSFIISHYGISYERVLTNRISVRLYGDYATYGIKIADYDMKLNGFGILPEFRYYVSKTTAPYGYFIGLYGVIRRYTIDGSFVDAGKKYTGDGAFNYYGFGFVNGPQFIIGNRIVIAIPFGLSLGGGNTSGNFSYTESGSTQTKDASLPFIGGSAIMPRFAIELGIAF